MLRIHSRFLKNATGRLRPHLARSFSRVVVEEDEFLSEQKRNEERSRVPPEVDT